MVHNVWGKVMYEVRCGVATNKQVKIVRGLQACGRVSAECLQLGYGRPRNRALLATRP